MKNLKIFGTIFVFILLSTISCEKDKVADSPSDSDSDGIYDDEDNCPELANPDQKDDDNDGVGNYCDSDWIDPNGDLDEDGIKNIEDNCIATFNPEQDDEDEDGIGNLCDLDWIDPDGDLDGDGIPNKDDNCIDTPNQNQSDDDGDNIGNECDPNPNDGPNGDKDGDGIINSEDSCPNEINTGRDFDNDGIDDACDPPPPKYELTFGLYDDFDGHGGEQTFDGSQLAVASELSTDLWRPDPRGSTSVVDLATIENDSVSSGSNPSGNVAKMVNNFGGIMRLEYTNPEDIIFEDYKSVRWDMLFSSESTAEFSGGGMDFHTSFPDQGGGSWYITFGMDYDKVENRNYVYTFWKNVNTEENWYRTFEEFDKDIWYNYRIDITKLNSDELKVEFYINNNKLAETIPPDSKKLLNLLPDAFGPKRDFDVTVIGGGNIILFVDNVKAVYTNRIE